MDNYWRVATRNFQVFKFYVVIGSRIRLLFILNQIYNDKRTRRKTVVRTLRILISILFITIYYTLYFSSDLSKYYYKFNVSEFYTRFSRWISSEFTRFFFLQKLCNHLQASRIQFQMSVPCNIDITLDFQISLPRPAVLNTRIRNNLTVYIKNNL